MGEGEITRIGYAAQLSLFPRFSLLSSSFSVARRWAARVPGSPMHNRAGSISPPPPLPYSPFLLSPPPN